jgi:hypothetical protein
MQSSQDSSNLKLFLYLEDLINESLSLSLHLDWWELGPRARGEGGAGVAGAGGGAGVQGGAGGGGGGNGEGLEEDLRSWRGGDRRVPSRSLLSSLSVRTLLGHA